MKIETYIRNYAKTHMEPNQEKCPDLYIYWQVKAGELQYNPKTGEVLPKANTRYNHHFEKYYLTARSYSACGSYANVIKNGEILELGFVELDNMKRSKGDEIRKWHFYCPYHHFSRVFLVRETGEIYNEDGTVYNPKAYGKYYNTAFVAALQEMSHACYVTTANFYDELSQFIFGYKVPNEKRIYFWKFADWYKNLRPRKSSKSDLLEMELEPIDDTYQLYNVHFEIINDDYAVFRFLHDDFYNSNTKTENVRVFVDKNGKVTVTAKKGDKWVISPKPIMDYWRCNKNYNHLNADELKKFAGLKYISDLAISPTDCETVNNIITMLRHPIVEALNKAGYEKIAGYVTRSKCVKADVKDLFDVELKKEKGELTKLLDVNKYILQEVERNITPSWGSYYFSSPIHLMREVFGDKLKALSEDDVKIYFDAFVEIKKKSGNVNYWLVPDETRRYGNNSPIEDVEYVSKILRKLAKLGGEAVTIYMDAVNTYKHLSEKPEIDWFAFKKKEDLERLHDNLVGLLNEEEERRRIKNEQETREAFEKAQKKRLEWLEDRDSDDTYMMIVPRSGAEITTEGQTLSHCVGGYVNSYMNGYTNLVFLRKKTMPNTPFYTIEVSNDGYVTQIHGKYNRWLGNNPEAIAYVYNWIRERHLYCEDYKLLDKASGYSRSGDEVSRDYLNDNTVYQIRFA